MRRKGRSIREAQVVRRADMKRPTDVQVCIGTKHYPTGIEQKQIGPGDLRPYLPVDAGRLPAGDPAHNICDGGWPSECHTLSRADIELAKAMKQIAAPDLPHGGIDAVVWPSQRPLGPETAVQGELRMAEPKQRDEQHATTEQ
jgi:hypothetical protein